MDSSYEITRVLGAMLAGTTQHQLWDMTGAHLLNLAVVQPILDPPFGPLFKVGAYEARAACIAYLLPAHHHTLVEILAAAAPFGCTYTGGQKMYRKITPFGEDELRSCGRMPPGGQEKLFPDELSPVDGDKEAKAGPVKLEVAGGGGGAAP